MSLNLSKAAYAFSGLLRRTQQSQTCPGCGGNASNSVDRKVFHTLVRCLDCNLLYRFPYETAEEMASFYQRAYHQSGLTTELPDEEELEKLVAVGFKGSSKDFDRIVRLFGALDIPTGASILDFGANWGYGVWQLHEAGYNAIGYELSEPRSAFSKNLGVRVCTEWQQLEGHAPFDVVFSSHVLEHTPSPSLALQQQIDVLAPGGLLIAVMPNGSDSFRRANYQGFNKLWGKVHPVMLSDDYFRKILPGDLALGAICSKDLAGLKEWNKRKSWLGTLDQNELLAVWQKPLNSDRPTSVMTSARLNL